MFEYMETYSSLNIRLYLLNYQIAMVSAALAVAKKDFGVKSIPLRVKLSSSFYKCYGTFMPFSFMNVMEPICLLVLMFNSERLRYLV